MSEAFFSYSHSDSNVVQSIRMMLLQRRGFECNIWIDTKKMEVGQDLNRMMYEGISSSEFFVCFLTPAYTESINCMFELKTAHSLMKKIVPVVLYPEIRTFPFGNEELGDLLPERILRIEEREVEDIVAKIAQTLGSAARLPRSTSVSSSHRNSPGTLEAKQFIRKEQFTDHDLRNIRSVVKEGNGRLVNEMLQSRLTLSGRFALLRMANDAPPTPKGN